MASKSVDYGKIITTAKDITLKHRWLWVIGYALALFTGSSYNNSGGGGGNSSSSGGSVNNFQKTPDINPHQAKDVLGAATTAILDWFKSVPLSTWLLLGTIILLLLIAGIIIGTIVRNWSKAALIGGIDKAKDLSQPITLPEVTPYGFKYFKNIFLLNLISGAISTLLILLFGMISFSVIWLFEMINLIGIGILIFLPLMVLFIAIFIVFSFIGIYAERLVVLKDLGPMAAWKRGLSLSRGNFLPTTIMGFINQAIGCAMGCVTAMVSGFILGIPLLIIILPILTEGLSAVTVARVLSLILLFAVWSTFLVFFNGILTVFRYSTWNLFVNEVLSQEGNQ